MHGTLLGVEVMYKPKLEKDIRCPLEYGLEIFGGKWKSRIICVLAEKETLRYSILRREMSNITNAPCRNVKNVITTIKNRKGLQNMITYLPCVHFLE